MFQNVSDEAISAGDSASFIISQMIAFGIEAKDAQSIIDKVNETANKFSVSSGDLATALGIVASTSSAMGNSIDQTLGVVTAITEQTRNASKSARAANTIFSRLAQVVDENSDTGAKLTEIYDNLGIALYDSSGQMRSTYDILADLASKWDSLDKNMQQYIAITSAGTNQLNNFLALMNNFDHAAEATATSINSAGSAMRENEAFQESLEYQTNNLKATFQDLANNVIDKELISSVLKLGDAFLKLANTDIGVLVTKIGLLTGAGWGLSSLIQVSKIIPTIVGQFQNFGAVLSLVAEGSGTFGAALSAAGGAGAVALPIFLAVSAAIVGIVEAVKAYKESHPDFDTAAQSVSTLSDSLKTAQDRLDEINKLGWKDRTRAINEEEQELKDLIEQQERELQVAQMRQAMAAGEELSERTGYGQATRYTAISPNDVDNQTFTSMDEAVKSLAETEGITGESTDELKQKLLDLGYAFVTTTENTKLTADEMNALDTQALQELSGSIKENGELNTYLKDSYQVLYEELAPVYEKLVSLENAQKNAIPGARELTDSERELKGAFEQLVVTMLSFESSGDNAYQTIANLANLLSVTPAYARDLAIAMGLIDANTRPAAGALVQLENGTWAVADGLNAVKTASDGVGEAMSNISVATYDTSTAAAQLTASLFDQNGQLTEAGLQALSVDSSMRSVAQSELQAQQAAAQANYANLVLEIQKVGSAAMITAGQLQTMMALAGASSASDLVGGLASGGASTESSLKAAFYRTFGKSAESDVALYNKWVSSRISAVGESNYDKLMSETQKKLDELEKNFPTSTGGGSSRKSAEEKAAEEAEKQAKKAQKAQEKAAKESQQAYESAAKSAEQAAQQAAQAAKQAAEEAKQKILDSIQELKDASDKFWDSKTDAIEETNKELDRQKQLEEKLKALEEAKQKKILLYKNGQFQYDKDYGTIAKAQADYEETRDKIQRERELEQLKEMKDNATEIFNEMKDIVQNGGNVTQEMINSWLSQMQADGADYYDSNKQMLSEWLDWAKGAINEISNQVASATGGGGGASGGYGSGGGSVSGQWSHQDETNPYVAFGQDTIQEMLEWIKKIDKYQDDEEYMNEIIGRAAKAGYIIPSNAGLRGNLKMNLLEALQKILAPYQNLIDTNTSSPYVYAWKGLFKGELQRGTDLGSNSVFAGYQNKLLSGSIDDPYEEQEYYQRNQAIKALYNEYKKITDQLGYIPDYLKDFMDMGSQMLNNVDLVARQMADNYDNLSASGKSLLDSLISGEEDYEAANKMRIAYLAENYSPERLRYMNLVRAAGSSRNAMQLMNQRTEEDKARDEALYGDWLNELRDKIDKAGGIVTDEIYKWYLKTAGGALTNKATGDAQLYTDVFAGGGKYLYSDQEELERLGYHGFLGNFGNISEGGLSDVTKNLVKSKILTSTTETNIDKQKEQITQNNIKGIKDTLEKYQEGYGATQHWIDDASKYITDTLNKNNEALLTADAETRKSLLAQNDELMGIRDSLSGVEADEDVNKLPGSTTAYNDWEFKIENPTDEELAAKAEQRAQKLADQMAANSAAWWNASSKAEQDALHKANEELAKKINELTGSNLKYEGSTGTWSKNASGTHNFRGGLSLVGERGPELRVLGQGDNVIPAYQTANLWKWSGTTPESMLKTLELRKGNGCNSYTFNVSKLELPNVSNAKEFVAGLKNYALQYSYRR